MLEAVTERINELRGCKYLGFRLGVISDSWEEVSNSLLDYAVKLKILQSYIPKHPNNNFGVNVEDNMSASGEVTLRRHNALRRHDATDSRMTCSGVLRISNAY